MNPGHATESLLFVGPSIPADILDKLLVPGIIVCPPIRRGDLPQRLSGGNIKLAAIIDGEFLQNLAVSPKEILAALTSGVVIIGGASMGALRAVELGPYGMIGIGQVFEWYRSGAIFRDDDVAVSYGLFGSGYKVVSVPMVQVIWVVELGKTMKWLSSASAAKTLRAARRIPWAVRTWDDILDAVAISNDEKVTLRETANLTDQDIKCRDAIAIIQELINRHMQPTQSPGEPTRSIQ